MSSYFIKASGFRPNSQFVGRRNELQQLHRILFDPTRRASGTSAVLIQSLPGGGKTHLARQYVYEHRDIFPGGIFWLQAKSYNELRDGFHNIAREVFRGEKWVDHDLDAQTPKYTVLRVKDWFNKRRGWLIVLDGIHFGLEIRDFIPNSPQTSLIYTSNETVGNRDPYFIEPQIIKLPSLSEREAQQLLLLELGKKKPFKRVDMTHSTQLVQEMGFLPLAIHSVAQRLKLTDEPLARFAKSYSNEPMLRGLGTYTVLVERLKSLHAFDELNLMYIICFFSQYIPVEMISWGNRAVGSNRNTLDSSLELLRSFGLLEQRALNQSDDASSLNSEGSQDMAADNIEIVWLHVVVQGFFIDMLLTEATLPMWLARATALFCRSYDYAHAQINRETNAGPVEDYRLYQIHGIKIMGHLVKYTTGQYLTRWNSEQKQSLQHAQETLTTHLQHIEQEIRRLTRIDAGRTARAVWSGKILRSIFDREQSGGVYDLPLGVEDDGQIRKKSFDTSTDPRPYYLHARRSSSRAQQRRNPILEDDPELPRGFIRSMSLGADDQESLDPSTLTEIGRNTDSISIYREPANATDITSDSDELDYYPQRGRSPPKQAPQGSHWHTMHRSPRTHSVDSLEVEVPERDHEKPRGRQYSRDEEVLKALNDCGSKARPERSSLSQDHTVARHRAISRTGVVATRQGPKQKAGFNDSAGAYRAMISANSSAMRGAAMPLQASRTRNANDNEITSSKQLEIARNRTQSGHRTRRLPFPPSTSGKPTTPEYESMQSQWPSKVDVSSVLQTGTASGYIHNKASSSRSGESRFSRQSPLSAERSLESIAIGKLPRGDVFPDSPSSKSRKSPRPLVLGSPSYATAIATVTKDNATSHRSPDGTDASGRK